MRGLPFTFFFPIRSEMPIERTGDSSRTLVQDSKMNQHLRDDVGINSCANVVEHDANAARQLLELPERWRLQNIEPTKKYKTRQNILPTQRYGNQCNQLPGNLVNHHVAWIAYTAFAGHNRRNRDAYDDHGTCGNDGVKPLQAALYHELGSDPPESGRDQRSPC